MTQKNYAQMPTKKLNALLETTTDENEKAAIEEVLTKRGQLAPSGDAPAPATVNPNAELSSEEQAAIDAANGDSEVEATTKSTKKAKPTDEERIALAAKLREEAVGHKCQVVPFNSIEWVDGVVVAIVEEKRTNKCLYAVKADDGRRIVKAYGSELIKISDEVVELTRAPRGGNHTKKEELPEWTKEEIDAAVNEVIGNVGKQISYVETGALGKEIENAPTILGRIISLVPNKRNHTILYRIEITPAEDTPADAPKKYSHKVTTNSSLAIAEELDEEGKKINDAFVARRNGEHKGSSYTPKSPVEALATAKQQLAKAEELKKKTEERIEKLTAKITELEAKVNDDINSENSVPAEAAPSEENGTGTSANGDNDLM